MFNPRRIRFIERGVVMTNDSKTRIKNHLRSFEYCFKANESTLNSRSAKRIHKYISKIKKELNR